MQENTPQPASDNQPEFEAHAASSASAASSAGSASASSTAGEASHADLLPGLQEQIRILEQKAAEHHDAWLRAKAEGENIRRRAAEDVIKAQKFAIEKFAGALLPVKDGLEQTLAVDTATATVETLREGADLTLKNLSKAFEQAGVEEINPVGDKFDPHKHQAISAVPSDQPANTVVQVFQKGYQLEGRVLRPALVAVAQAA